FLAGEEVGKPASNCLAGEQNWHSQETEEQEPSVKPDCVEKKHECARAPCTAGLCQHKKGEQNRNVKAYDAPHARRPKGSGRRTDVKRQSKQQDQVESEYVRMRKCAL